MTVKDLALGNLIFQILLIGLVSWAAFLAKRKQLKTHCTLVRIAVILQLIVIAFVMTPSMVGYLKPGTSTILLAEILTHHTLGLLVVGIWVYVNLVMLRVLKTKRRLITVMRIALLSWIAAILMGGHLYLTIYRPFG
ncbi:MAG: hypothetical protein HYX81_01745 [Chloroflexi bacterium]|nr:hypothetical protein [Chloroflexota bacterium]